MDDRLKMEASVMEWHDCRKEMPEDVLDVDGRKSVRVMVAVRFSNGAYKVEFDHRIRILGKNRLIRWKWYKGFSGVITHWAEQPQLPKEVIQSQK